MDKELHEKVTETWMEWRPESYQEQVKHVINLCMDAAIEVIKPIEPYQKRDLIKAIESLKEE